MKSLNVPAVDVVKEAVHRAVDSLLQARKYNQSTYFSIKGDDDQTKGSHIPFEIGDVRGNLTIQFSRLEPSYGIAMATRTETLVERAKTLPGDERRKLAEEILAGL